MNAPTMRQTAVLVMVLAAEHPVDLMLADLEACKQVVFHRELLTRLPGVACLFVAERMSPEALARKFECRCVALEARALRPSEVPPILRLLFGRRTDRQ